MKARLSHLALPIVVTLAFVALETLAAVREVDTGGINLIIAIVISLDVLLVMTGMRSNPVTRLLLAFPLLVGLVLSFVMHMPYHTRPTVLDAPFGPFLAVQPEGPLARIMFSAFTAVIWTLPIGVGLIAAMVAIQLWLEENRAQDDPWQIVSRHANAGRRVYALTPSTMRWLGPGPAVMGAWIGFVRMLTRPAGRTPGLVIQTFSGLVYLAALMAGMSLAPLAYELAVTTYYLPPVPRIVTGALTVFTFALLGDSISRGLRSARRSPARLALLALSILALIMLPDVTFVWMAEEIQTDAAHAYTAMSLTLLLAGQLGVLLALSRLVAPAGDEVRAGAGTEWAAVAVALVLCAANLALRVTWQTMQVGPWLLAFGVAGVAVAAALAAFAPRRPVTRARRAVVWAGIAVVALSGLVGRVWWGVGITDSWVLATLGVIAVGCVFAGAAMVAPSADGRDLASVGGLTRGSRVLAAVGFGLGILVLIVGFAFWPGGDEYRAWFLNIGVILVMGAAIVPLGAAQYFRWYAQYLRERIGAGIG